VVAIFVQFADTATRERLPADIVGSLRRGGLLVLQGVRPKQLDYGTGGPPIGPHLFAEDLVREAFAALEIVESRTYESELTQGRQHRGRSALLGLVARKP
jgi:hypothetical protein